MNSKLLFALCLPTEKEIEDFLNNTDFDLVCDIAEESMLDEQFSFSEFYDRYQAKHLAKYGHKLPIRINLPITLKN